MGLQYYGQHLQYGATCGIRMSISQLHSSQHQQNQTDAQPGRSRNTSTRVHHSKADYCNVLFTGLPSYLIKRLQAVQNHAARVVTMTRKFDRITPVLASLHWLPVEQRIIYKLCMLVFKSLHGSGPSYLRELIQPYQSDRPGLRSEHKHLLSVPKVQHAKCGRRSFAYAGPQHWNTQLTPELRACDQMNVFKKLLKTRLYQCSFN